MARSIEQIYQEILLAKDAEPLLRGELTTKTDNRTAASRTAIWQLWCYVFAVVAHSFERLWDLFKQDINDIIDARRLGTPEWYVTISKDFQYASMVEFDEQGVAIGESSALDLEILGSGLPGFVKVEREFTTITDSNGNDKIIDKIISKTEVNDSENFVVKLASFKESRGDGLLQLKVANQNGEGTDATPEPLTPEQLSAFASYIDRVKFAGTYIQILSTEGDEMTYRVTVYIDSTRERSELEQSVKDAIAFYVRNLSFDGIFVKNELIETVREVDGVTDAEFQSITFQQAAVGEDAELEPVQEVVNNRTYETRAGYIKLDGIEDGIVEFISLSDAQSLLR